MLEKTLLSWGLENVCTLHALGIAMCRIIRIFYMFQEGHLVNTSCHVLACAILETDPVSSWLQ